MIIYASYDILWHTILQYSLWLHCMQSISSGVNFNSGNWTFPDAWFFIHQTYSTQPYGKPSGYAVPRKVEDGLLKLFLLDKCVPTHCQINFMAEAKILVHLTVSSIVIKEALFYM